MNLHLFHYECENCGNSFKVPELIGDSYGEFILRSKTGKMAYLFALNSFVFKEFSNFLKQNSKITNLEDTKRARILHAIFYTACDLASDGSVLSIVQQPICSKCGGDIFKYWGPTNPPEIIELNIPPVTHERWNKLSENEKKMQIVQALNQISIEKI